MYLKKVHKYPDPAAKDACMDIRAAARVECNRLLAETEAKCEQLRATAEATCNSKGCEIDHIKVLRAKARQNFSTQREPVC